MSTQSTQRKALPYRHVLTVPTEPSAVRMARETAEQALVEWGISGYGIPLSARPC